MAKIYYLGNRRTTPQKANMGKLTDESPMPFGAHKEKKMEDVPADYLLWLWNSGMWKEPGRPVHHYIKDNIAALEMDAEDTIVTHDPRKA